MVCTRVTGGEAGDLSDVRLRGDATVTTVVCWKLDRLSRRLRDEVNLLAGWCECAQGRRGRLASQAQWRCRWHPGRCDARTVGNRCVTGEGLAE